MKKMIEKRFAYLLAVAFLLCSCQETIEYPIEPQITYQGFTYLLDDDSVPSGQGILSIGYTDGDGDLGLDDTDNEYPFGPKDPYYYNLIIDYLKWDGAQFVETPLVFWNQQDQCYDTISFSARFKRLTDSEEPKAISGTIDYTIDYLNPLSPHDSIKFRVCIVDRALHISNSIETEIIN